MTTLLHFVAGVWILWAASQLVAFYALFSSKGVTEIISYPALLAVVAVGAIVFLASTSIAWLIAVKKYITLAITLSALMCLYFPFGSILGILTIVLLMNPANKTKFNRPRVSY